MLDPLRVFGFDPPKRDNGESRSVIVGRSQVFEDTNRRSGCGANVIQCCKNSQNNDLIGSG